MQKRIDSPYRILQRDIEELLKRPVGRPAKKPLVEYKGFLY